MYNDNTIYDLIHLNIWVWSVFSDLFLIIIIYLCIHSLMAEKRLYIILISPHA